MNINMVIYINVYRMIEKRKSLADMRTCRFASKTFFLHLQACMLFLS